MEARKIAVEKAMEEIKKRIKEKEIRMQISEEGAVAFILPADVDRSRMTDGCIYRRLVRENSWEFRNMVAEAEARTGRRVNIATVNNGTHSHDGGVTWGRH